VVCLIVNTTGWLPKSFKGQHRGQTAQLSHISSNSVCLRRH